MSIVFEPFVFESYQFFPFDDWYSIMDSVIDDLLKHKTAEMQKHYEELRDREFQLQYMLNNIDEDRAWKLRDVHTYFQMDVLRMKKDLQDKIIQIDREIEKAGRV